MVYLESADIRRSARLANKYKQKYGLFSKFSLALIGACDLAKNPHIFLTRSNQCTQKINRHFYGTLDNFGSMLFAANLEQNYSGSFKDMLLQPDKSYFVLAIIKEVEAHEARGHWILMKNSDVNNKHKNKYEKLKTILSICYFKGKSFPDRRLFKHKARLCANVGMQQWVVNY